MCNRLQHRCRAERRAVLLNASNANRKRFAQMSIEQSLERIAAALELVAGKLSTQIIAGDAVRIIAPASKADHAPAKPVTIEELRGALQGYAARIDATAPGTGMAKAREVLAKYGKGATRLAVAKDVPGGIEGVLEPSYYKAVIDAARRLGTS